MLSVSLLFTSHKKWQVPLRTGGMSKPANLGSLAWILCRSTEYVRLILFKLVYDTTIIEDGMQQTHATHQSPGQVCVPRCSASCQACDALC